MPAPVSEPDRITHPLVLAIDVGSSSTRSGIFDSRMRPVDGTFSQDSYSLITGHDGQAELDPEVLVDIVASRIDASLEGGLQVEVVGVSSFWHSLLGLAADGRPTTNVLTWADTRAATTVAALRKRSDERAHHQRTGTRLHSSYPAAKIRWLHDSNPEIAARTRRWISFPEYLQFRLTGHLSVSVSMASGTGLLDRTRLEWNTEAVKLAGTSIESLAKIDDDPITGLAPEFSERWRGLRKAVWLPAIGDGAANNLGSDSVDACHPALMIGTTGALRLLTDAPPPETLPANLWQYRLDKRHALLGGALSEGGGVLAWMFRNLNLPDEVELNRQIAGSEPDSHGLTVLPYLAGERSPGWNSAALGTVHGLRFDTRAVEIVQASMESIAYSFASILDGLKPFLQEPVEIIATGNGLRMNPAWIQIIADVLGYPLLLPRQTEASLRGAAMHALRELGAHVPPSGFATDVERFEPNPDRSGAYDQGRSRHDELYRRLVAETSFSEGLR